MESRLVGFALNVFAVPLAYASLAFYLANSAVVFWPPDQALGLSAVVAAPLVAAGLAKWWDIWVRPEPKLGADWSHQEPGQFAGVLLGVNATVIIVLCLLFVGWPVGNRRALLVEAFEHRKTLKLADLYPAEHDLPDERLADVRRRLSDIYKALGYPERTETVGHSEVRTGEYEPGGRDTRLLLGLIGVVTLWSLYTPRRIGFHSGKSIQG